MDPSPAPLRAFGRWVQRRRRARGLPLATAGGPAFGAAAIRALERGAWRPSPLAWALLVRRLGLGPCPVDVAALPAPAPPDLAALDADVAYHLDHVKAHLEAQADGAAQALLTTTAALAGPHLAHLTVPTRYRWHRLRAGVALRHQALGPAQAELALALALAHQLGDPQEIVRTRNVLGAVYYTRDQPAQALVQHEACLHTLQPIVGKDRTLYLNVVANLANAYWALGQPAPALAWYQEARRLLADLADPARTAAVAWGLSLVYRALGDAVRALLAAREALTLYTELGVAAAVAQVQVNLAELLREQGAYPEAAALLAAAAAYQQTAGNALLLGIAEEQLAQLELAQGASAAAAEHAAAARARLAPLAASEAATEAPAPVAHARRAYARALRTAGLVAERLGDPAQADAYFAAAVACLDPTEEVETRIEVARDYAELWLGRGAPAQAGAYYRQALPTRPRPAWVGGF